MDIPNFDTKEKLFKFLKENKSLLIANKKSGMKRADSVSFLPPIEKTEANKAGLDVLDTVDLEKIKVSVVINTTNIMDSHDDVHMVGIWNKSLKEQRSLYLLQEHQMTFDNIITDDLTASVKMLSWKALGFPEFIGTAQALVFDAVIDSDRNEKMFDNYLKGYVKNHSVGMQYVNLYLCMNSNEKMYAEEKANWDKYILQVVNADKAMEKGYFWAVTEAKIIEGSAVPIGSNFVTPTLSVSATNIIEAENITSSKNEPLENTQISKQKITINQSIY